MNKIALDLGIVQIYWYSIFILIAVFVSATIIYKEMKKQGITNEQFTDLLFNTVVFGIIGARLYYVVFNLNYYLSNPIEILEIWQGGLAIHGGIIFGLIYVYFFSKKRNLNTLKILDMMVVGVILGQAIGRWGNFFNQEAFGSVSSYQMLKQEMIPAFIIKGMKIFGVYYEPTFYYESLWDLNGFIILCLLRNRKNIKVGQLTGFYFLWYSVGRFYIESLRLDSLVLYNFKIAQIASIILGIVGVILIIKDKVFKDKKAILYHPKETTYVEET